MDGVLKKKRVGSGSHNEKEKKENLQMVFAFPSTLQSVQLSTPAAGYRPHKNTAELLVWTTIWSQIPKTKQLSAGLTFSSEWSLAGIY